LAVSAWGGLAQTDYRTKTFSCSRCGAEASLALVEPMRLLFQTKGNVGRNGLELRFVRPAQNTGTSLGS